MNSHQTCQKSSRARAEGFTLIEALIAMAISAVLGTMAYTNLDAVSRTMEINRHHAERLSEINRAFTIISRDIQQIIPRGVRDKYGEPELALSGDSRGTPLLSMTRNGWLNPRGLIRSNLQRVQYDLDTSERTLYRSHWNVLDRVGDSEPVRSQVLKEVERVDIRFYDLQTKRPGQSKGFWRDNWNVNNTEKTLNFQPAAIEITIELEDWGKLVRLFETPG